MSVGSLPHSFPCSGLFGVAAAALAVAAAGCGRQGAEGFSQFGDDVAKAVGVGEDGGRGQGDGCDDFCDGGQGFGGHGGPFGGDK